MQRYSIAALARHALGQHHGWTPLWRKAAPKPRYEVVIIGGGGHGLATAYYLAKEHGIRDVAVLEKGPIGLGNTGRNTTIIRSNYLWDESAALYEHSLKLWEGLTAELNFNLMLSQRGVLNLAHTLHDVREGVRRVNANRLNGVDADPARGRPGHRRRDHPRFHRCRQSRDRRGRPQFRAGGNGGRAAPDREPPAAG